MALDAGVEEDGVDGGVLFDGSVDSSGKYKFTKGWVREVYFSAKLGMLSILEMSAVTLEALEGPCSETKASRRSWRRPTAVMWMPLAINLSAMAFPMPDVAPMRRMCLYGKDMVVE